MTPDTKRFLRIMTPDTKRFLLQNLSFTKCFLFQLMIKLKKVHQLDKETELLPPTQIF